MSTPDHTERTLIEKIYVSRGRFANDDGDAVLAHERLRSAKG